MMGQMAVVNISALLKSGCPQGFMKCSSTLSQDCNPVAIIAMSMVKLRRKTQVDGDDWRHSSDVDTSNPQGISAIQISPACSDIVS